MRGRKLIIGASVAAVLAGTGAAVSVAGPASAATGFNVAPYVDLSANSASMLDTAITQGGLGVYTAAFVIGSGCTPIWGDSLGIDNSTVNPKIARAQSEGAQTIISFGGAGGAELAQSCTNVSSLTQAYQSVINKYGVKYLDFDIEGAAIADQGSVDRRFQAIRSLQGSNPGLNISLTIPVLESGPDANGANFLRSASNAGVNVAIVNAMTMDYGHAVSDMAAASISAAQGTLAAARNAGFSSFGYGNIGITPMIGNNDSAGEVVSQANAQTIVNWAKANGVGRLAFWSIGRDQPCAGGGVSPNCSGLGGSALDFTKIFTGGGGSTPPAGGPSGYTLCANENGTCSFSGTASVAYGANGAFNYKTATGSIACNNATFGDPIPGTAKACYYQSTGGTPGGPSGYTLCANENGTCSFSGTANVAYGANGAFNYKAATSSIACNNATFGDPIPGTAKACYYQSTGTNPPGDGSAWAPNTPYSIGAIVTYAGHTYRCRQAHTSLVGWEPSNVPALWDLVS